MRPSLSSAVLSLLICLSLLAVSVSPYEVESHNKLRRRSFTTDAQPECKWPPEYAYAFTSLGNFLQWTTQFIEATFYRAYLDTTMPYSVFGIPLGLEIPQKKYRMSLCRRENVANCLYYGEYRPCHRDPFSDDAAQELCDILKMVCCRQLQQRPSRKTARAFLA